MTARIDHFMYAVASLDDGIAWAGDTFGVAPAYGGEHIGLGTRNALLSLGSAYLEIIAPDPAQSIEGTLAERFAALREGGLVTWAAEGDLAAIAGSLDERGVSSAGPNRTERKTADGDLLVWELLFPVGSPHGGRMPFFIDWLDCPNPKDTNPGGGEFQALSISTAEADGLRQLLTALGLDIDVREGAAELSVTIAARNSDVILKSTEETSRLTLR